MAKLTFLGATETVTGSKFLLEHEGFRLLVDCGLFQGHKELRLRNWSEPPFDPAKLDMVVLTHAHLDHSGYLPVLCRRGFEGTVLATPATADLCGIILPDSGHIQEEDARFANKRGYSKHDPALPLYTEREARDTLRRFRPLRIGEPLEIREGLTVEAHRAGHIIGAASIEVRVGGKTIVFSGDLGRPDQPILPDPARRAPCDQLLLESTYGNREHPAEDPKDRLASIIQRTAERGGTLLIPAFAVGRTQHLLYLLRELQREGRMPTDIPIHLNSPMAIEATRIVTAHCEGHDREMRELTLNGEDPLGLKQVRMAVTVEESKALNDLTYPAVIISASGMAEGGRILHHLVQKLPDHRSTVLFVGFQAAGTRGRALQEGAKAVRIHGREVHVRANVETLDGLSAHADRSELIDWYRSCDRKPRAVHLVHGEPGAMEALSQALNASAGVSPNVARYRETVEI